MVYMQQRRKLYSDEWVNPIDIGVKSSPNVLWNQETHES